MKSGLIEIRYHGRGGQGAKTLALLFAQVAFSFGKHIQAFPEYGPERMGAPVQAFNRLSDKPILLHCAVTAPDIVVVLDSTLFKKLPDKGIVVINTEKKCGLDNRIYAVDASGMNKPNMPLLGVLIKIMEFDLEKAISVVQKKLRGKYEPKIVRGNIRAIREAYGSI